MRRASIQVELSGGVGQVFNLAGECGVDPDRVIRERREAEKEAAVAREFERKMQIMFEQCPGFIGADAPASETSKGRVIVEPAMAREARDWLKRRFHVNDNLDLSDQGLCIEVMPRIRKARGGRRVAVSFAKREQFTLRL